MKMTTLGNGTKLINLISSGRIKHHSPTFRYLSFSLALKNYSPLTQNIINSPSVSFNTRQIPQTLTDSKINQGETLPSPQPPINPTPRVPMQHHLRPSFTLNPLYLARLEFSTQPKQVGLYTYTRVYYFGNPSLASAQRYREPEPAL